MIYQEAKNKVLEYLNKEKKHKLRIVEPAREIEFGWVFSYNLESTFHPKIDFINQKLKKLIFQDELSQEEAYLHLSREEIIIIDNSVGLVGNVPVFIDKETGEIEHCLHWHTEVAIQNIRQRKFKKELSWKIYLKENLRDNLSKVKELRKYLNLKPLEILKANDQSTQGTSFFESEIFEQIFHYQQALTKTNINYQTEESNQT